VTEAVGRGDLDHLLDRLPIVEAPVAAHHELGAVAIRHAVEDRLHKILDVMRLLERLDLLAQARGARPLVRIRFPWGRCGS
jgi:hypothetical protein